MRRLILAVLLLAALPVPVSAEPMRKPEVLYNRPSGFWTSNAPAVGGAYKWRLLAIGSVICGLTAYFVVRLIRRTNAERLRHEDKRRAEREASGGLERADAGREIAETGLGVDADGVRPEEQPARLDADAARVELRR